MHYSKMLRKAFVCAFEPKKRNWNLADEVSFAFLKQLVLYCLPLLRSEKWHFCMVR